MQDGANQPASRRASDWVGRLLEGRFRVDRSLGEGGMGVVYLATDTKMDRKVVVKVPHARFLAEQGFRERFEKEIQSLTSLEHPHVVKALDAGVVDEIPFAVLQYLAGGSLKDRMVKAGGPLSPSEVAEWLPGIAQSLDFIHGEGVIHRDVKPGNILFDKTGNVFLGDFGIAKALGGLDTGLTQTGATPGSPDYMAPEAVLGTAVTPPYDQYALAIVVYEALCGRLPFHGPTPMAVLFAKQSQAPRSLLEVAPHIPPAVAAVVERALKRDPAERFATCKEFAIAFQRAVQVSRRGPKTTRTVETRPPDHRAVDRAAPPSAPPVRWGRRIALGLVLLLLALGGVGYAMRDRIPFVRDAIDWARGLTNPRPAETPVLLLEEPVDGALLGTRELVVSGTAKGGSWETVLVNEVPVLVKDGRFRATTTATAEGPFSVRVVAGASSGNALRLSRTVVVDTVPPEIQVDEPKEAETLVQTPEGEVRGVVHDDHPGSLSMDGRPVTVGPKGEFRASVPVPENGRVAVELKAVDSLGHPSEVVRRSFHREARWTAPLTAAIAATRAKDWPAAEGRLAEAMAAGLPASAVPPETSAGIAAYRAPPVLTVDAPAEGASVTGPRVAIRGRMTSGRATDRVYVASKAVEAPGGVFQTEVKNDTRGPAEIVVEVRDGAEVRASVRRQIRIVVSREGVPPWAVVSDEQIDAAVAAKVPVAFENLYGMRFVLIPAGTVKMGSPADEPGRGPDENLHDVRISRAYYLQMTEVTNAAFERWKPTTKEPPVPDHPKEGISYKLANEFADWVGAHDSTHKYRLPTEAEWEHAARAGATGAFGSWSTLSVDVANFDAQRPTEGEPRGSFRDRTLAVGLLLPNRWGLYDVLGNCWEWCSDWYGPLPLRAETDPTGPRSGTLRVLRGGGKSSPARQCRCGARSAWTPDDFTPSETGFRLLAEIP